MVFPTIEGSGSYFVYHVVNQNVCLLRFIYIEFLSYLLIYLEDFVNFLDGDRKGLNGCVHLLCLITIQIFHHALIDPIISL